MNKTEKYVAKFLKNNGYMPFMTNDNNDENLIVAVKDLDTLVAKVITSNPNKETFNFYEEITQKQIDSLAYVCSAFKNTDNIGFAIYHNNNLYWLSYWSLLVAQTNKYKCVEYKRLLLLSEALVVC